MGIIKLKSHPGLKFTLVAESEVHYQNFLKFAEQ